MPPPIKVARLAFCRRCLCVTSCVAHLHLLTNDKGRVVTGTAFTLVVVPSMVTIVKVPDTIIKQTDVLCFVGAPLCVQDCSLCFSHIVFCFIHFSFVHTCPCCYTLSFVFHDGLLVIVSSCSFFNSMCKSGCSSACSLNRQICTHLVRQSKHLFVFAKACYLIQIRACQLTTVVW